METLLRLVVSVAFEIVAYWTARLILPIVTVGVVRVQPLGGDRQTFNWLGFRREPGGRIVCSHTAASTIGWVFFLSALAAVLVSLGR